ncbi:MAG: phage integrase N-terminal SAM-like domain-containing protein [Cyanobacteria bacterium SBC]|nr:phage integrase N-terminal SAM-like domain-containing protein [Cyanobacteria bacterium SBC]
MGDREIKDFLTHLAVNRKVAAATQNQALNALLFLYRGVLKIDLGNVSQFV